MLLAVSLLASTIATASAPPAQILPLERMRLYETGMGYFERAGKVTGKRATALPLPASHLDDALKTLVVLSPQRRVKIGAVAFKSAVSEGKARATAGLPLESDTDLRYLDLLRSLEGISVELRTSTEKTRGQLVEVLGPFAYPVPTRPGAPEAPSACTASTCKDETASDTGDGVAEGGGTAWRYPPEPEYTLVVRTSAGELRRVRTHDVTSIRPVDPGANARVESALAALSSRAAQANHPLLMQLEGTGPLRLGYIAEIPVWRTTYRVVLNAEGEAILQAWALIHNDTDEDWRGVRVELVNGQPTSFLFPLAAPRYARRQLESPEVGLSTVPQLLSTTADQLWGDHFDLGDTYGYGGLGEMGYGTGSGGGGVSLGGRGSGSLRVVPGQQGAGSLGDLAELAQATGEEAGVLFVYRLPAPLDLAAHHSALVPVVQQTVEAEPITWFSATSVEALRGARLVNSTQQTLPAGTVAFFHAGGFAGESSLDRLKPGEQSFSLHGADLDVDLARTKEQTGEQLRTVGFARDNLVERVVMESRIEVELHNRSGRDRVVYVGLPVSQDATVAGHEPLDFDHDRSVPLARFELPAGSRLQRTLRVQEATDRWNDPNTMSSKRLAELSRADVLSEKQRELLKRTAQLRRQAEALDRAQEQRTERRGQISANLERLRANLAALGKAGLKDHSTHDLGRRLVVGEDELEALTQQGTADKRTRAEILSSVHAALTGL